MLFGSGVQISPRPFISKGQLAVYIELLARHNTLFCRKVPRLHPCSLLLSLLAASQIQQLKGVCGAVRSARSTDKGEDRQPRHKTALVAEESHLTTNHDNFVVCKALLPRGGSELLIILQVNCISPLLQMSAGYAGDVWDPQPPPEDHPWRKMPNHGMTPHYSGTTLDAQVSLLTKVLESIDNLLKRSVVASHSCAILL